MAVMKNNDIATLTKVWRAMTDMYHKGKLSEDEVKTLFEFSDLMKVITADKENSNNKAKAYIAEKRKTDKNYARTKLSKEGEK